MPVLMDDGRLITFRGFRVQYNDALGPCMGGIHVHSMQTLEILEARAMWQTFTKCRACDIPAGGSFGGISADLHNMSAKEQRRLYRGYVQATHPVVGEDSDLFCASTEFVAYFIATAYELATGRRCHSVVAGKSLEHRGLAGLRDCRAQGAAAMLKAAAERISLPSNGLRVAIQGFGNMGANLARLIAEMDGVVVAISYWDNDKCCSMMLGRSAGIDVAELLSLTNRFGAVDSAKAMKLGYDLDAGDAWLGQEADVLVPAALENQITGENVGGIHDRVRIVLEGANGAITPEADQALSERNVLVVPDLIANGGSRWASYLELVQGKRRLSWSAERNLSEIERRMTDAFHAVADLSEETAGSMRDAAYKLGVQRVATAAKERWAL